MASRPGRGREIRPFFGGPPGAALHAGGIERAEDPRAVFRRLWGYLRPFRARLTLIGLLVAVVTVLMLLGPYLMRQAIDDGILAGDLSLVVRYSVAMLLVHVLAAVGSWAYQVAMIRIGQEVIRDLRSDLFDRLQSLSLRYFDSRPHGEVMSCLTNDTEAISGTLAQSLTRLLSALLSVVGAGAAMLLLNWRLGLLGMVTVPVTMLVTKAIAGLSRRYYRDRQEDLATLNGLVEETISGQRVIKICGRERRALADFAQANDLLRNSSTRAGIYVGLMGPMMQFLRNLGFAVLAGFGGWMVVVGLTTVGTVAAFLNYAQQFSRPLLEIASLYGTMQSAVAGAERVFRMLDEEPEVTDAPDATPLPELRGDVEFDRVTFAYRPDQPVLRKVSFHARPGETIALVGPTGAGKTTIINLLTRFYDIDQGQILVDGLELKQVSTLDLRRRLGIVLQDTFLFAGTVRENIRYGRLDASDAEVVEVARLANADSFITRLPHGYETVLSEDGGTLSQGQRQLLAIARAMLADPAVLILDEATSSVDSLTEAQIQQAMLRLMAGRTSFIIAHRLSTVRHCDRILVIDQGAIVERGSHDELLAAGGMYADLWRRQHGALADGSAAG